MTREFQNHSRRRWAFWLIGIAVLCALVLVVLLSVKVMSDLRDRQSARTDNVQWTLTQVEVEFLSYLNALEAGVSDAESKQETLDIVRRRFDLFYSRIDILSTSRLFETLRADPKFAEPLAQVSDYLEASVPTIDAADAKLKTGLPDLYQGAREISPQVRELSVSAISYFASQSDQRREETALSLFQLAILSGGLFLTLAAVSAYLLAVNRKAERRGRAIRQANQRMNTILSTSLDAVIVVDAAGKVLEFNAAAQAIFGHSEDEAKGHLIGDLIVPAHLRDAHTAGMERMQRGGDRHVVGKGRVQLEAMRKNGDVFPVELALQSAQAGDEEIVIGFVRDISQSVADQKELVSARDRALAGEKAKSDFLTVMSHEIRTPLNGLLGNLTLLKNTRTTRQQSQFVRNMEISGQILQNHVDAVLDIARFEAGKLSIAREPTDLNAMLQDLVDGQSGNAASRGNSISWQWVGGAFPNVATDAQRLRQILLNLVGNAIKFTENGRISIEVERCEAADQGNAHIYEVRVIDTGVGIAEDEIDTIFDDFYTSDPSIGRTAGGTGLGLGIARRFAQAMGGELGAESTLGAGSVFWLRLPLQSSAPDQLLDAAQISTKTVRPLNLLVVEDNEINLEVICNMLALDGHRVTTAKNGQVGVDKAKGQRFDAILMDISMPVMDGPTAAHHIRNGQGQSADVPIIAVSANVLPDAVEAFRAAGMTAFIGKPISIDALRRALSMVTQPEMQVSQSVQPDPLAELKDSVGPEVFARLHAKFIAEGDEFIGWLETRAFDRSDSNELARACHKLAGSAATFGAEEFREALVAVEIAAKEHKDITDKLAAVSTAWERAKSSPARD
ncbi:ATP-binding protein [Ruegeria sp. HKCCA4008]|uniref:ATP-binding protein n=1 Tax=Ruegeria sp. HKCCA4008 TaxID=2682999 RepID=UPI001489C5C2|nr:ATP-binding protein [Ruegeria sp. HKCCA4008]